MKLNSTVVFVVGALVLSTAGCKSGGDEEGTAAQPAAGQAGAAGGGSVAGTTGAPGPAPVFNSPSQAVGSGSFRIKPANPSDPKFKPDPRLAGGG